MSPNVPIPQGVIATPMYPVNGTARGNANFAVVKLTGQRLNRMSSRENRTCTEQNIS